MIHITMLGSFEIRRSDGTDYPSLLGHPKPAALLVYLAVAHPTGFHRRDTLTSIFWPEQDSSHARASLRQALYFLREALGHEAIVTREGGDVRLREEICSCDVVAFHTAIEQEDCHGAADLYAGPFLDGFYLSGAPEFERWVDTERDRFSRVYAEAVEHMANRAEDPTEAVGCWRRLADHDPHSGRVALQLMKALEVVGKRAAAIRVATKHATLLKADLDANPDPDVESFARQLRDGSPPDGTVAPAYGRDASATQGGHSVQIDGAISVADPARENRWIRNAIVAVVVVAVVIVVFFASFFMP